MKTKTNKAAGIIVVHSKTKKVLLLYRPQYRHWEYSKGRIESGEKEIQTAKRELKEEVNIRKIKIAPDFKERIRYSFKADGMIIRRKVVYFLGFTSDRIKLSSEHSAYRWCTFAEAKRRFKHRNYIILLNKAKKYLERNIEP